MKDVMKNGYSKIDVRCKHSSSMIMGDVESDEHLRIFKCLIDTGSHVLRNAIGIKVLNNNSISFIQYLENNKHQFYHQFEKKIWRKCCLGSPHGCVFPGTMDKKIFNKMYNKTAEHNTQDCLDRFETHAGISLDVLDLSDLNFFLWNSSSLSAQEEHSLKTIMSIRSAICHPSSSHSYSIDELEIYWSDLKSAVVLFAEPKCYKDIVEMQVETLQNCKLNVIESAKVIEKMKIESNKILHAIKQATPLKIVDIETLIKDGTCGLKNCVKSENNKTKSYINDTFQEFKENIEKHHEVLSTRCREEIQTTVTQESRNTRLHSEDQSRATDTKLTESEQRVCQTVIQSQGRLEDKLIEEQNKTRNHTVELKADLMEENRFLKDEVMDVKTELKELKTILIGYIGKQKVDLVMNTDQIEKSIESPDKRKVNFTATVNQTHVTADKENEIIENLPPEVEIQTNNDSSPEAALTEKIEITGKKTNSIILELKATPGILHSVDTFKAAILRLVQVMQTAGGTDVDIEDTVTVNLKFESPLTEDQFAVVKCLFAKEWNSDNDTKQLLDECSSISDEYLSTADVDEIESPPELDIYSQKGLELENSRLKHVVEGLTTEISKLKGLELENSRLNQFVEDTWEENRELIRCVKDLKLENSTLKYDVEDQRMKNRGLIRRVNGLTAEISKLKDLKMENSQLKEVVEGLTAEISKLKDAAAPSLVKPFQDDIGMISKTEKLGMKLKVSKSDDFSLVSEHTYGVHNEDSKLRDLLRQTHIDDTGMCSVTEKLGMTQKDLKSRDQISLKPQQTHYLSSKTIVDECRNCFEKDEIIIQLDRRLCEIRRRVIEAKNQSVSGNIVFEETDLLQFIHQTTNMTSVEEKERMTYKELKSGLRSKKPELISDIDVRDPEKKANKKLMESQASHGRRPELDQTEEKGELSLRISEIRREYASSYYTKTDKQKGLGIILQGERSTYVQHVRVSDHDTSYLQEFFEEIGFVVKCTENIDPSKLLKYRTDGKYYCIFIVIMSYRGYDAEYLIRDLSSQIGIGKPVIIMTDCVFDFTRIRESIEDNEILIVKPIRQRSIGSYRDPGYKNIIDDFMKVTRSNRFANIIDILTRINSLYDYSVITFQSTLRKKLGFL